MSWKYLTEIEVLKLESPVSVFESNAMIFKDCIFLIYSMFN